METDSLFQGSLFGVEPASENPDRLEREEDKEYSPEFLENPGGESGNAGASSKGAHLVDDGTDIYRDEEPATDLFRNALKELQATVSEQESRIKALESQLAASKRETEELSNEKEVLLRNMSCLFKTAREEISRKEKYIAELRQQLAARTSCMASAHNKQLGR